MGNSNPITNPAVDPIFRTVTISSDARLMLQLTRLAALHTVHNTKLYIQFNYPFRLYKHLIALY